jgi:DNA processing protein
MNNNLLYKIAITQIDRVGPIVAKNLISYCGGVKEVFSNSKSSLAKIPGVGYNLASEIKKAKVFLQAETILKNLDISKTKILFYLDDDYPFRLNHFNDSPLLLYHTGTSQYNNSKTIGIVGTRNATIRGKKITEEIIRDLKDYGITVISGLAFGIDAIAHKASIENDMPNIAFMGNGIDITYPSQHHSLRREIEKNGDVMSEFPRDLKPDKGHFPMRNRIIAAMSDALLVVESDIKGGSMITAKMAFNYSKDVFAIPGRLEDRYSKGTNFLIKTNVASLVDNAEDIAKMMNWSKIGDQKPIQMELFLDLNENEQKIVNALKETELDSLSIDKLLYATELSMGQLASVLLKMEFRGIVENLPGARYMLFRG